MEHEKKSNTRVYSLHILKYATGVQYKLINNATKPRAHNFFLMIGIVYTKAVFSSFKISKILQDSPSHQIFRRMHGALNIGKKITNYTVLL
jgi:hypothetical protein